jgi:hypothetical protein
MTWRRFQSCDWNRLHVIEGVSTDPKTWVEIFKRSPRSFKKIWDQIFGKVETPILGGFYERGFMSTSRLKVDDLSLEVALPEAASPGAVVDGRGVFLACKNPLCLEAEERLALEQALERKTNLIQKSNEEFDRRMSLVLEEVKELISSSTVQIEITDPDEWDSVRIAINGVFLKEVPMDKFVKKMMPERYRFLYEDET